MDSIIIADDVAINRTILRKIFEEQYSVLEAENGEEVIRYLSEKEEHIAAIFLDLMMPKVSGFDVLKYMNDREMIAKIPVIIITGGKSDDVDEEGYEYGASDIIKKPFTAKTIKKRTTNLIELYKHKNKTEVELKEATEELRKHKEQLATNNEFLINALGSVVEFRSAESGNHIKRVSEFTRIILENLNLLYPEYNLSPEQIDMIAKAAALHDVGKIAIPDNILGKPSRLTSEEYEEMKHHTVYGCDILEKFKQDENNFFKYCYEICRWHHEKFDGGGYPDHLVGDNIPIWAQAVSIADCFDALVSKRVYKNAYSTDLAFKMIKMGDCGVFSPKMLDTLEFAKSDMFDVVEKLEY